MPITKKGRGGPAVGWEGRGLRHPSTLWRWWNTSNQYTANELRKLEPDHSALHVLCPSVSLRPPFCSVHGGTFSSDRFDSELCSMLAAYSPNVSVMQQGCSNADTTKPFYTLLSSLLQLSKAPNHKQLDGTPRASSPVLHPTYSTGFQGKKYPYQMTYCTNAF